MFRGKGLTSAAVDVFDAPPPDARTPAAEASGVVNLPARLITGNDSDQHSTQSSNDDTFSSESSDLPRPATVAVELLTSNHCDYLLLLLCFVVC